MKKKKKKNNKIYFAALNMCIKKLAFLKKVCVVELKMTSNEMRSSD